MRLNFSIAIHFFEGGDPSMMGETRKSAIAEEKSGIN